MEMVTLDVALLPHCKWPLFKMCTMTTVQPQGVRAILVACLHSTASYAQFTGADVNDKGVSDK